MIKEYVSNIKIHRDELTGGFKFLLTVFFLISGG